MSMRLRVFLLVASLLTASGGTLWIGLDRTPDQEGDAVPQASGAAEIAGESADFVRYPEAVHLLQYKLAEAEKLEADSATIQRRALAKQQVAVDLIAGRLVLLEAAARFRELDAQATDSNLQLLRLNFPGSSDEERYCRQVIHHVQSLLESLRQAQASTVTHLEAELQGRLKNGSLHLPTRPPAHDGRLR